MNYFRFYEKINVNFLVYDNSFVGNFLLYNNSGYLETVLIFRRYC